MAARSSPTEPVFVRKEHALRPLRLVPDGTAMRGRFAGVIVSAILSIISVVNARAAIPFL